MKRLLWLAVLCCCTARAEMRLYVLEGYRELPAGPLVNMGTLDAGDAVSTAFRIRSASVIGKLSVAGMGFALQDPPPLPKTVAAGAVFDFTVRFQALDAGSYSAVLAWNDESILLRVTVRPAALLSVDSIQVAAGTPIQFGSCESGTRAARRFSFKNRDKQFVDVPSLSLAGAAFRADLPPALSLAPGATFSFDVIFEPQAPGPADGLLETGNRRFPLRGVGVEPPLPPPEIRIEPEALQSGQQAKLSIRFAVPAAARGTGNLRLEFRPDYFAGGRDDLAIRFLSGAARSAAFFVQAGGSEALFGTSASIEFQTGTTAGVLTFTAELGAHVVRKELTIRSTAVMVDSVKARRETSAVEIQIAGFDNSRSVSQLAFTFFESQPKAPPIGLIVFDATAEFRRYFEQTDGGGVFLLRTIFPVRGDPSRIDAVEIELTNAMGLARTGRIRF